MIWNLGTSIGIGCKILVPESAISALHFVVSAIKGIVSIISVVSVSGQNIGIGDISDLDYY